MNSSRIQCSSSIWCMLCLALLCTYTDQLSGSCSLKSERQTLLTTFLTLCHDLISCTTVQESFNGLTESFLQHLFAQFPTFWTVLQQASWNWLFFFPHLWVTILSTQKESYVSMHLTAEATYYFCLSHLPHPLFSSELRSHLSLLWVPARKNWCTECDLLSV